MADLQQSNVYPLKARSKPDETTTKEEDTTTGTYDLGSKAMDSYIVRRKQLGSTHLENNSITATSGNPIHSKLLIPGVVYSTPTKFTPFKPLDLYPQRQKSSDREEDISIAIGVGTQQTSSDLHSHSLSGSSKSRDTQSPTKTSPSFDRNMKDVVQQAEQIERGERLAALVQSIEAEMQQSGVRVDCSELKAQLNRLRAREITADTQSSPTTSANDYLKVGFHFPSTATDPQPPQQPIDKDTRGNPESKPQNTTSQKSHTIQQTKPKDWASLFQTQGPSKVVKLSHYPELQQGDNAVVKLEENDLNDRAWSNCLIGYFLDGKMPFPLLSATAMRIWKDHGKINIKQVGACFFFEFQDEETKQKVLEGGPYFFSRRYLVLKDWHRMLVPTTEHPSTIPAWVKIHKLPLECWTDVLVFISLAIHSPSCNTYIS